jgi:DNA repair protein RadC
LSTEHELDLSVNITQTPVSERPRERCLSRGASSLSLRECLALILGSGPPGVGCLGLAHRIATRPGEGLSATEEERAFFTSIEVSPTALMQEIPGLREANQAKLLAAFEIGRRYALFRENRQGIHTLRKNADLSDLALLKISHELRSEAREWLGFIPYYRNSELGELCVIERGVRTHVNIDPAELFARLLALRPSGFFLAHNHPSGDATPSEQDFDLTRKVASLAKQFGIRLISHWIVTSQSHPQANRLITP